MINALEVKPLIAAAALGALVLWLLAGRTNRNLALGAGIGAAVQVGVRLLGVS